MTTTQAGYDERTLVLDVETTGVDLETDRIVEISFHSPFGQIPGTTRDTYSTFVNPKMEIPEEAAAVHGIRTERVQNAPPFERLATWVAELLDWARVIIGYNVMFDLQILSEELRRSNIDASASIKASSVVDPFRIWKAKEERTLEAAYDRFKSYAKGESTRSADVTREARGSDQFHSAAFDVKATSVVLAGMVRAFGLEGISFGELAEISYPDLANFIGLTDHVVWSENESGDFEPFINFGKWDGWSLFDCASNEEGFKYLRWVTGKDFPPAVRFACQCALRSKTRDELVEQIASIHPRGVNA